MKTHPRESRIVADERRVRVEIHYLDSPSDYQECLEESAAWGTGEKDAAGKDDRQDFWHTAIVVLLGGAALIYAAVILIYAL